MKGALVVVGSSVPNSQSLLCMGPASKIWIYFWSWADWDFQNTVDAILGMSWVIDKSHGNWAERIQQAHPVSPFLKVLSPRNQGLQPAPVMICVIS